MISVNMIAAAIQDGADAFIRHEYKMILGIAIIIAIILGVVVSWFTGVAFILGAVMSASAGWIGMNLFRHKTRKLSFKLKMVAVTILNPAWLVLWLVVDGRI